MSENVNAQVCIMVPIAAEALGDLSAADILKRLQSAQEVDSLKAELQRKQYAVNSFGNSLTLILDEVDDLMAKFKALRDLATEMKKWK